MNFSIINCTPHRVTVLRDVFGLGMAYIVGVGATRFEAATSGQRFERCAFSPSGIRLAAAAETSGPALGCSVQYHPSVEAIDEMAKLKLIFSQHQGSRHIVIASEISCRAMAKHAFDGALATDIELMWPVLAGESLRLPPAERWADKLAKVQDRG